MIQDTLPRFNPAPPPTSGKIPVSTTVFPAKLPGCAPLCPGTGIRKASSGVWKSAGTTSVEPEAFCLPVFIPLEKPDGVNEDGVKSKCASSVAWSCAERAEHLWEIISVVQQSVVVSQYHKPRPLRSKNAPLDIRNTTDALACSRRCGAFQMMPCGDGNPRAIFQPHHGPATKLSCCNLNQSTVVNMRLGYIPYLRICIRTRAMI